MSLPTTPAAPAPARDRAEAPGDRQDPGDLQREVERLRRRIAELEGSSEARNEALDKVNVRSDVLAERVKELKCLYSISALLKGRHSDLGEILQKAVEVLPSAWQYPERACACITLKSRRYQSQNFREPQWRQHAHIVVDGESVGLLEIGYTDELDDAREPEFLPEEHLLLSSVAAHLAEIVSLKEAQSQLSTYQQHLRSLASELTLAEERERRALALSLHDRIGQGLAVAKLKLESLTHVLPAEHHQRLEDISALIKQIVQDTRSLTFEISPPILYELGLQQAIAWLTDHFTHQFGLRMSVRGDTRIVELVEGVRVMLFRSIQELLSNAVKHSRATRVTVTLQNDLGELHALVEDDGVGFDAASLGAYPSAVGGFGLFSIRERIGHLGGRVAIDSRPGQGTRIRISVPCADAGGEETGASP
ncbi:MAG TPA: sensor histidine kinase [Myxococcota bacterium]|nr:sensor histidine kinase [Myxococcota bacterium]HRY92271.1 sensor histidine kinase [Myxococcota bacterium]HSA24308.1 sensor histidine kinase [Myxococcota bacterium]